MSRISAVLALSLALALGACGGKKTSPTTPPPTTDPVAKDPASADPTPADPAPATPSDAELDAMFAETLIFFDKMADAIAANSKDCKAMAKALDGVFSAHAPLMAKAKSFAGNKEVDAKADAYMKTNEVRLTKAMEKMGTGAQSCGEDEDFKAVMKRFDEM